MRQPFLRNLPTIRHKLVAVIMLTSATVLLLASIGFLVHDYFRTRDDVLHELETQARLVLENSVAAIEFNDHAAALSTLETLGANPHLRAACLYDGAGRLFVEFRPMTERPCAGVAAADHHLFGLNRLSLVQSFWRDSKRAGALQLSSNLDMIWTRLRTQTFAVLILLFVSLGIALLLSARLQKLVSQPVIDLADTARQISSRGDYSLRAQRTTEDELGVLVEAFNRMLERIQLREAELSQANEELRREVAERKRAEGERAELLVREREANRLKDEFLATLSHELRTPLNAILGWTRLLRAQAVPEAGVDRALEKVERNAQIQTRLVEDLLEISRITSGKLHLEIREVDLVSIVNTAVDSIRPAAEARGVAIECRFSAPALATAADGDRLQQVVWNLLSNAVKFTPTGGSVTVTLERQALLDELKVADTGIGIDPAFLAHVFDTFRQADASSTRRHGGLGLGLSIVRHLVEMHGGAVEAHSAGADTGSTFTVRLPVRALETRPPEPPPLPALAQSLTGATILVVDDDADTRELLTSVFEKSGARVRAAGSAGEALAAGLELRPDALVSDIAMPGVDGCALMSQLDEALGDRAPRARIALTASVSARERERTLAAGFQRHVTKPFDPAGLVLLLEELLGPMPLDSPTPSPPPDVASRT